MPGKIWKGNNKIFLSIVEGNLRQKVDSETKHAVKREYEVDEKGIKIKKSKWELTYESWVGVIQDIRVEEGTYGQRLKVMFEDAILDIPTGSRYFQDFGKKIVGADINKEIIIKPFDFETEKEGTTELIRLTGISIDQDGKKLKSYFWNEADQKTCHGLPEPTEKEANEFDKDDWKNYYNNTLKKFLLSQIEGIVGKIVRKPVEENEHNAEDSEAAINDTAANEDRFIEEITAPNEGTEPVEESKKKTTTT